MTASLSYCGSLEEHRIPKTLDASNEVGFCSVYMGFYIF